MIFFIVCDKFQKRKLNKISDKKYYVLVTDCIRKAQTKMMNNTCMYLSIIFIR